MSIQKELRLCGSGGQGLILAGVILADAALLDGKRAIQSQSYGPEARGGASKAEVIISEDDIDFTKVRDCDMLLCLTQSSYDRYGKSPTRVLIVDENIELKYPAPERAVKIPILDTASEKLGRQQVANIVALGALNGVMRFVTEESLLKAVLDRVPRGTEELNKQALEAGYELVGG